MIHDDVLFWANLLLYTDILLLIQSLSDFYLIVIDIAIPDLDILKNIISIIFALDGVHQTLQVVNLHVSTGLFTVAVLHFQLLLLL